VAASGTSVRRLVVKLGSNLLRRFAWVNHNTWDNLKEIGTTAHGNVVKINRTFAAADVRVTISVVKAHAFAGYGGGAKAILPGVTGFETVCYNHEVVMKRLTRPPADVISMFKNEVRLDMDEAARLANVDFSVQILYNGKRQVTHVFAGEIVEAHRAACRAAVEHYQTKAVPNPDIVICNTYPQSTQGGRYKWASTVREGGSCVLILQHPQGLSAMHYWDARRAGVNGKTYLDEVATPRAPFPGNTQLMVYSQYMDKRQMLKFPSNTIFAASWEDMVKQLQARHKGDARVAIRRKALEHGGVEAVLHHIGPRDDEDGLSRDAHAQAGQILVRVESGGEFALRDRMILAMRHVFFARPQQFYRRPRKLLVKRRPAGPEFQAHSARAECVGQVSERVRRLQFATCQAPNAVMCLVGVSVWCVLS